MHPPLLETQPLPPAEGFLRSVDATVCSALGESFSLWIRQESQWTSWPGRQSSDERVNTDRLEGDKLLDVAAESRAPASIASGPDRLLLAIPFFHDDASVVALASLATEELPRCLAASVQNEWAITLQLNESRLVNDDSARQISEDLEHVTYLRSISDHLQLCDVSRSPLDLARSVLPLLRDLIRAETLVFLARPASGCPGEPGDPGRGDHEASPVVWVGRRDGDPEIFRILLRRFQSAVKRQPVVRNRLRGNVDGTAAPGLDSFVLTQVAKGEHHSGWLLAINRKPDPERENFAGGYPPWGLSDEEFGTVESGLMQAVASMLATHAHNVHLFQEKECLLIGVLRSLINAMDAKDSYTCGHSDRVALVARRLGEELRLPADECNSLYVAGLLHDIGKIGVPDAVLLKPGKLTEEEFAHIQRHPQQGHTILRHLDQFARMLPGVLHHHERYDGRGYPSGLKGEAIPVSARILAVADGYDAMSSCRPYRTAMPEARVEAILKEGAGTQWDPQIIAAFFRIFPEIRAICDNAEIHTKTILTAPLPGKDREKGLPDDLAAALSTRRTVWGREDEADFFPLESDGATNTSTALTT
jgi:HD-GYP domain-containing protein (c-di-GMP phosphodiesterase class II)